MSRPSGIAAVTTLVGLAALALVLGAQPAAAQASPRPAAQASPGGGAAQASPGATGDIGVSPGPGAGGGLMQTVIPPTLCQAAAGTGAAASAQYPLSAYTIDYDEGGFADVSRKAVGTLTDMTFATVRWVVGIGTWLVGWAFSFGVANRLAAPMAAVAGRYQSAFFVPLLGSALLISAAYGAVQIFRGRIGRGVGEFTLSLLLVAVFATWLLSDPKGFLDAAFRFTAQLAGSVASVALPGPASGCPVPSGSYAVPGISAAVAPLTDQIDQAFVQQPYELLEWGAPVPASCRAEADAVLAAGPGGDRNQIVSAMDTPGCSALYQFNRQPSTERLGVAVLVLVASALLMLSLGLVAGSVVIAQVVAVALIALMPFAALAAALPGAGRSVMWHWGTALVRALATIVVMAAFLTFLLVAADALLASGQGQSLLVQMAVLNVVAVLGFSLRHRVTHSGRFAAERAVHRLQAAQPALAAAGPGIRASPASGPTPGTSRPATGLLDRSDADPLAARVASAIGAASAIGVTPAIGITRDLPG
jgi:hypothetical protein